MFTTIITDCKSENAASRQETRFNAYSLGPTSTIGVSSNLRLNSTMEAAGNLIDILDASEGKKGIIIVNVAPRGDKKDGPNGSNFCYFYYKNTLVISTLRGYCLSLVKKLNLVDHIYIINLRETLSFAVRKRLVAQKLANYILNSQFRSFDFLPKLAKWLTRNYKIPSKKYDLNNIKNIPSCIWLIDAFGNCKTTLLKKNLTYHHITGKNNKYIKTNLGIFPYFSSLNNIPKGKTAIYTGSSGINNYRFLEIATQGKEGSAESTLNLKVGTTIKIM